MKRINSGVIIYLYYMLLIFICLMFECVDSYTMHNVTVFSIVLLILAINMIKKQTGKLMSISTMFLIANFIIHFGQPFLIMLGYDNVFGFDQRYFTSEEYYIRACVYSLRVQYCVTIGMIISISKCRHIPRLVADSVIDNEQENIILKRVYTAGLALFMISIIPRLYVDVSKFILYLKSGYLNTYNANLSGYIQIIAKMADIAVILLIAAKHKEPKFCLKLIVATVLYHCIFMITGNRGEAVMRIIVILFVYFSLVNQKLKFRSVLLLLGVIWVGAAVLDSIGELRFSTYSLQELLGGIRYNLTEKPVLLQVFAEFGVSIRTVCDSIKYFPERHEYAGLWLYIKGLFLVFPNIGGYIKAIVDESMYIFHFPTFVAMGGSFVGELYFAFGALGFLGGSVIGFIIGKLDYLRLKFQYIKRWDLYVYIIVSISPLLWWVRDYYCNMVREIVWPSILIFLMMWYIKGKSRNRGI